MATTYSTAVYVGNESSNTGHGFNKSSAHLHATSGSISTWAINDVVNVGYLPANAVVVAAILKAASQIDSNGAPTLTLSLGVTGTPLLFKNAVTTVGRVVGASADATLAGAGYLYKVPSTGQVAVLVTVSAAAATAVAGTLEVDIEFYVEDVAGSAP